MHMWGVRVMLVMLPSVGWVQFSNRKPWEALEQTSGLMKLMLGVRSLGVTLLPPLSWPGPALALPTPVAVLR